MQSIQISSIPRKLFDSVLEFRTSSIINNFHLSQDLNTFIPQLLFEERVVVNRNKNGEIILTNSANKPFIYGPTNSILLKLNGYPSILVYAPGDIPRKPIKFKDINGGCHEISTGVINVETVNIPKDVKVLRPLDSAICVDVWDKF